MKKNCDSNKKYTTRATGEIIGIVGRVFKLFLFNILIFVLGFSSGYSYVATRVYYYSTKSDNHQYIQQLNLKVDGPTELDLVYTKKQDKMMEMLSQLSNKIYRKEHSELDSYLGKFFIKKVIQERI